MANTKISNLPAGSALDGTEVFPLVQSGQTVRSIISQITDYAGSLNLANIASPSQARINLGAASIGWTDNPQTTDYTLQVSDFTNSTIISVNSGSARVITVPTNASAAIPTQRSIIVRSLGAGSVTITPAGGVTINNQSGSYVVSGTYGFVVLSKIDTNTWILDNPIPSNLSNSQFATMLADRVKGQLSALFDAGSTATPVDLTPTQIRNIVNNKAGFVELYSDFTGGTTNEWNTSVSGSGAAVSFTSDGGDTNHPGIATLSTGTTTTGSATVRNGNATVFRLGDGIMIFDCCVKFNALSNGTDTYTAFIGIGANVAAGNGAWFQYTDSVNSGKFQVITQVSGGNQNVEDSGITVAASSTYYRLTIVSNSNSTSWKFYINGVQVGTTHTTNIPTASQRNSVFAGLIKSAGTTSVSIGLDYMYIRQELTTTR